MEHDRRYTLPHTLLALILLAGMTTAGALAQAPLDAPPHPTDEPRMVDIPESDNPAVAARNALMQGNGSLKDAEKYLARADEAEGKKREKLEARAQKAYETAAEHFLTAIQYDNELTEAYAGLGEVWLRTGQAGKALQAWGAAQKRAPEDPEILFGLGRCLVTLDRPSDAAQVYVMLLDHDAERGAELLDLLRAWGEPRAAEGNEAARGLMAWIDEQG
jgi:tetratricopeptide (TPR) repeat protein